MGEMEIPKKPPTSRIDTVSGEWSDQNLQGAFSSRPSAAQFRWLHLLRCVGCEMFFSKHRFFLQSQSRHQILAYYTNPFWHLEIKFRIPDARNAMFQLADSIGQSAHKSSRMITVYLNLFYMRRKLLTAIIFVSLMFQACLS